MLKAKPAFVFVHGAWSSAASWRRLIPLLEARGHVARAIELPGSGAKAKAPAAYGRRPLDPVAFSSERSPNGDVTQGERTQAVVDLVEETERETGAPVVLVGHSLGGLTITAVAEAIPDRLHAVVYLAAFLLPPGGSVGTAVQHPAMQASSFGTILMADPAEVGAFRIDPRSEDGDYRERMRLFFGSDMSRAVFDEDLAFMYCDEPFRLQLAPSVMSAERFGRVPRHYIRALEDRAIPIEGQDFMIASVDGALASKTKTHDLTAGHSAACSRPGELADVLVSIAADSLGCTRMD